MTVFCVCLSHLKVIDTDKLEDSSENNVLGESMNNNNKF